jgi:cysteine synthase
MSSMGLETEVVDTDTLARTIKRFKEAGITLPTFAQLRDPETIPAAIKDQMAAVDPDKPLPLNLFRVHWYNDASRRKLVDVPEHVVLHSDLTGIEAPVIVVFGKQFPMIRAHKVLAAYGCLAPRIITGQFDPTRHRAIWPSTGNYCRGGVAISRIMGCHGVAVLPEGMSEERFSWLQAWVADQSDIVRTYGTESNVKEIYDKCHELQQSAENFIFNQFCEFGNHLVHFGCTGPAFGKVFESVKNSHSGLNLKGFVSATGSAGTIAAGDYLKEEYGTRITAVEALECPTMLYNGFGEHNIQGIGDKHIPYIHNVMNTDMAVAVSDKSSDALNLLFNTPAGCDYLTKRRGLPEGLVSALSGFGISGIANVLAAIKMAKHYGYGHDEAILTVATDGGEMYRSELSKTMQADYTDGFDEVSAAEVYGQHLLGVSTDHVEELDQRAKERIFNLGYYTWVEQQGMSIEDFQARRNQTFWRSLRSSIASWDDLIQEFNQQSAK